MIYLFNFFDELMVADSITDSYLANIYVLIMDIHKKMINKKYIRIIYLGYLLLMHKFKHIQQDDLSKKVTKKCLDYQKVHIVNLIRSLARHKRALDASDTGTGKTYASLFVCIEMKLIPFIVCPKTVIASWRKVLHELDIKQYFIINYESLQNLKWYRGKSDIATKCRYLSIIEREDMGKAISAEPDIAPEFPTKLKPTKTRYLWQNIPNDMILIFDEAHKCKNRSSNNSELLYSAAKTNAYILMLSATIAEKPKAFVTAGYVLGLYREIKKGSEWINHCGGINNPKPMMAVHKIIFNDYASRMKKSDAGNNFKRNVIEAVCFEMKEAEEIQKLYDLIEKAVKSLRQKEMHSEALAQLTYARMRIEMLKVPEAVNLIKKLIDKGYSIAVFTNYTDTINKLSIELKTKCIIYGEQTIDERDQHVDDFNNDKQRIILCNIRSGGVGISLHDLNGKFPRVAIIFPSYSAQDTLQSLGRIHRAGGKTDCLQYILYCKDTIEESMCENIREKIINISCLNNGDKFGYVIKNLIEDDKNQVINDVQDLMDEYNVFDDLYSQMISLNAKRDRLTAELADVNKSIVEIQLDLEKYISYT